MKEQPLDPIWEAYKDKARTVKSTQILEDEKGNGVIICEEKKFWAIKFKNSERDKLRGVLQ